MKTIIKIPKYKRVEDNYNAHVVNYFMNVNLINPIYEFDVTQYQLNMRNNDCRFVKQDYDIKHYLPFKNNTDYEKLLTYIQCSFDNTILIVNRDMNYINLHQVSRIVVHKHKSAISILNENGNYYKINQLLTREYIPDYFRVVFFMMDNLTINKMIRTLGIKDYIVINLSKTLYNMRNTAQLPCYNGSDYEVIGQYYQYAVIQYRSIKDGCLTDNEDLVINNYDYFKNKFQQTFYFYNTNYKGRIINIAFNNRIMHAQFQEGDDYDQIQFLINIYKGKVVTLNTKFYNKVIKKITNRDMSKLKLFNQSLMDKITAQVDKFKIFLNRDQRILMMQMFFLRINHSSKRLQDYVFNGVPEVENDLIEGICYSEEMEQAAKIELDLKHMYTIKHTDVVMRYNYVKAFYLVPMYQLAELQRLYIYNNIERFDFLNVKVPKTIKPKNFYYKVKAVTATVSDQPLPGYKHCKCIEEDLKKKFNEVINIKVFENDFTMEDMFTQVQAYAKWYFDKLIVHGLVHNKIKRGDLFNISIFMLREVVNSYRGEYQPYNDKNNVLYNSYKFETHQTIVCNIMKAFTLMNTRIKDIECTCFDKKSKLRKVIKTPEQIEDGVIIYNTCQRTLYAAFKRQCRKVPFFEWTIMNDYYEFCDEFFDKLLKPVLDKYTYSFKKWVAKETEAKQKKLSKAMINNISVITDLSKPYIRVVHRLFCKSEKQAPGGKNRAIAGIDDFIKYITGPLVWPLEQLVEENTKFYCGHKNAKDYNKKMQELSMIGDHVVEGDGSGFDQTQFVELKYIDYLIYNYLIYHNDIYHMNDVSTTRKKMIRDIMCTAVKELNAEIFIDNKPRTMYTAQVIGTVFSGSADTTFANTVRMAVYNAFTLRDVITLEQFQGLHKGDDFVEIIPFGVDHNKILQLYGKYWLQDYEPYTMYGIGQVMKKISVKTFDKIEFCSSIIIPNRDFTYFAYLRDPKRMFRFGFYSRKAAMYNQGQFKQYLLDLYMAFVGAGLQNVPFYWDLALKYKREADSIPGKPIDTIHQKKKPEFVIPDDYLFLFKDDNPTITESEYDKYVYDRDYMYSRITHDTSDRVLDHISQQVILDNLNERYGWDETDRKELLKFLEKGECSNEFNSFFEKI